MTAVGISSRLETPVPQTNYALIPPKPAISPRSDGKSRVFHFPRPFSRNQHLDMPKTPDIFQNPQPQLPATGSAGPLQGYPLAEEI
jgi:hypothetical protein